MNKAERSKASSALKRINKCKGDCKHCKHCEIKTSKYNQDTRSICFAYYCKIADKAGYQPLSNSIGELKRITQDCLQLELS